MKFQAFAMIAIFTYIFLLLTPFHNITAVETEDQKDYGSYSYSQG